MIPTMTFENSHVRFYISLIMTGEGRHTTHLLKCVRILSTSQTDWRAFVSHSFWHIFGHSFWHSFWHIFWHSFWHNSDILSDISSDISSDILSDILFDILPVISSDILSDMSSDSLSDILFDTLSVISSGILSDILFDILSDMSSDISPRMIAVEVRRGTLNSHHRGWGPARNTELTDSQKDGNDDDEEKKDEEEEEEDRAHIKSNNPHLTGGELKLWIKKI